MNGKLFPKKTQEKGVKIMPKVGDKHFPYTTAGMNEAEDYAMETNQEVIPTYDAGGRVQNIKGYGEAPVGASMLPEPNGAMTDEEAVKYLNPLATAKEGGKVKTYEEKGKTISPTPIKGQKGKVTSRRDLKEAVAEKEQKKILKEYKEAQEYAKKIMKKKKK